MEIEFVEEQKKILPCAYEGGADGGGTNPYAGGAPFLLMFWLMNTNESVALQTRQ